VHKAFAVAFAFCLQKLKKRNTGRTYFAYITEIALCYQAQNVKKAIPNYRRVAALPFTIYQGAETKKQQLT